MNATPIPVFDKTQPVDYSRLARVIAVVNDKGGVGKSSISANVAGEVAADGDMRVLLLSLDPQDNTGEDLGYAHTGRGDGGENFAAALLGQEPLSPLKDVRPHLDVVSGGKVVARLNSWIQVEDDASVWTDNLARALEYVADDYDLILIDCPPGLEMLQKLALVAARWMLVPTHVDAGSRKGFSLLADLVIEAREWNDALELLGVVLFNVPVNASRIKNAAVEAVAEGLQTSEPIFTSTIRTATAAAFDSRERGQLLRELAQHAKSNKDVRLQALAARRRGKTNTAGESTPVVATSAIGVAGDYEALATEIITALAKAEDEQETQA